MKSNLKPLVIEVSKDILKSLDAKYIARKQKEYAKFGYKISFKAEKPEKAVKNIIKNVKNLEKNIKKYNKQNKKYKKAKDREKQKKLREKNKQKKFIEKMNDRLQHKFTPEESKILLNNIKDIKGIVVTKDGLISEKSVLDEYSQKSLQNLIPDKRHKKRTAGMILTEALLDELKEEYYEDKDRLYNIDDPTDYKIAASKAYFDEKTRLMKKLGGQLNDKDYVGAARTKKKLEELYKKRSKTTLKG